MREYWPIWQRPLADDAAKPRMGVQEAKRAVCDNDVRLSGTGFDAIHVTGHRDPACWPEPAFTRQVEQLRQVGNAQRIAASVSDRATAVFQGRNCQAHAVETCRRTAPVKAIRNADQPLRFFGKAHGKVGHRGWGYCTIRSLPGRYGSP